MSAPLRTCAVVLAGRREGQVDPLAAAAGLADKCLVPVAGRPMIAHVLAALAASPEIGRIVVSVNDPELLDDIEDVRELRAEGRLVVCRARTNLVDSVFEAVGLATFPVLVTTADNALLSPAAVGEFLAGARAAGAEVAVAFARRASVLAAHPEGQRRFYRFADESYSNCNSYWIGDAAALGVAEVFRSGGQFAKHPVRIVQAFGFVNLVRFHYGIGTLAAAFRRFSRRFGLAIHPVILSDGAVAIDVDNARTLAVTEAIFAARAASAPVEHRAAG
ncbi:NTP transferase domain-containing protein [Novosphingobium soli]|uniref:NTP transferase domain-containing protein n=1 Tax=Novosphingobium soli TaxID=574956 RepID=A0ABV6CTB8_9SPHN